MNSLGMNSSKYDVVLIGSGISSLTAAAMLSKKGKSVLVLEQYSKAGGYMHCFSRFGDRFDTGAHYVGAMDDGQPFNTLLRYLDVYDPELFVPLNPDGFDVFEFPEFQFSFPKGYEALVSRLSDQFPNEAQGIRTYFNKIQEVVRHFPTYNFSELTDFNINNTSLELPLASVVEPLTENKRLKCLLYSYCALHGVKPEEVSFGMHAIVTDSLIRGPYGLARGGDALTQKFITTIEKNGGKVLTKKRVISIENSGKLAHAVVTQDGERYETDWIISGIHPKRTLELVSDPSPFSRAFCERLSNIKESVGLFGVYAACSKNPGFDHLRNYYCFSSEDPEKILSYGDEPHSPNTLFITSASRVAGETKNAFTMNIHSAGPAQWFEKWDGTQWKKRPQEYEDLKRSFAEKALAFIDTHHLGFQNSISQYTTSTPLTNAHFNGTPEGAAYGLHHSIQNTGARALGPRTHIANLLLTGQNCLFPGLLGAAVSALRTSGHIIGIKSVLRELRELGQTT